ncbi:hypothetical protein ABEX47_13010 [Paenibacillus ehimensis]|uniref:hypothetical protein n=1 Tax=Paenibacillus ehimensis TaxID=79264 RepID=UPI002DBEE9CF|nr:hypothetical protein [Paenibacillus ehimensis]MEC0212632.1 hypothetical protein [Paenibacillus ehimensis]
MKEAIIVDVDGYMTDVTLVADNVTGVFPYYYQPKPSVRVKEDIEGSRQPISEIIGYVIAVPVSAGLYRPRFDFSAWEKLSKSELNGNGEPGRINFKKSPEDNLWVEGLTSEEIDIIHNHSKRPSKEEKQELETLGDKLKRRQQYFVSLCKRLWN